MPSWVTTRASSRRDVEIWLWLTAVLFFGIGDAATTTVGLQLNGVTEIGPLVSMLLQRFSLAAMVVVKLLFLAVGYAIWKRLSGPHSLGIPFGLALVGVFVTGWNLHILFLAWAF